jgi:hypothetical protein
LKKGNKHTSMNCVHSIQDDLRATVAGKTVLHVRDRNVDSILVCDALHVHDLLG